MKNINNAHNIISADRSNFLDGKTHKPIFIANLIAAIIYFALFLVVFEKGNSILFWLLIFGEIFHLWQLTTYIFTVWGMKYEAPFNSKFRPPVDVFITVAGEPEDIVARTVMAAKEMRYPKFEIFILNDGYVTNQANWREIEELAARLGVNCVTRKEPGGAKAGNINNILKESGSPFLAVFDADHVPYENFLSEIMGYFIDYKVAFVQTPQFYKNRDLNLITAGSWEQQELFFGAICNGKNRLNSVFMCGTNMVIRREALMEVGGLHEGSIAEDVVTSLFIHQRGWKSVYVPKILAEGLAPEDFLAYYKQQFRWARGGLDIIFKHNPILKRGLTWAQKVQYLSSASYFLSGLVVLINALLPIAFFYLGIAPLKISTMALGAVFLPYIFLTTCTLLLSSNFSLTFNALSFSMAAFPIHIKAILSNLFNMRAKFEITPKRRQSGNFLNLVMPHLIYIVLVAVGIGVALLREGLNASVISNISWAMFNISVFVPFIVAAAPSYAYKTDATEVAPEKIPISSPNISIKV